MKQRVGIGCQQREHHFRLGVAETSIELNHFNTLRRLHQSAIEHARQGLSLLHHPARHRFQDMLQCKGLVLLSDER